VFSPRLVLLRVDSSIWQQAVNGVASVADVPLVDISEPTDNLLWEIEQLNARFGPRCVFVGEYARVVQLGTPALAEGGVRQVQRLLDGRTILAYTTDVAGTARFARALRGTLEQRLRKPLTGPRCRTHCRANSSTTLAVRLCVSGDERSVSVDAKEKPAVAPDRHVLDRNPGLRIANSLAEGGQMPGRARRR
jgi:hypothetical protein